MLCGRRELFGDVTADPQCNGIYDRKKGKQQELTMAADSDVSALPNTTLPLYYCYVPQVVDCIMYLLPLQPETEVFEITDFTTASEWERCCEEES